ncbi:MAG: hydroxyacid dehydrogenase [Alphaproteobacteria bacterium]|nr:hydroxyacid dehydrogenase [Alphaproteobacteria bacterium]MCB9927934.1 hydroxyacid dehydrogenase [Alphaproteobacteria bacterium]
MAQYRVMLQMPYTPGIASVFDHHPEIAVEQFTETSEANIVQHIANYDAAILGVAPFTPAIIAQADKLKIVARHGVGYDAVNVPALTEAGIPLAVVGIANSITVAEHSLFFMMALAKRAFLFDREARKGNWDIRREVPAYDLAGRKALVLGYGRIGRRLVPMLNAMQMQVYVYDPYVIQDAIATGGATPVEDFRAVLGDMDFVSVNCPKNEETTGMIGTAEMEAMKPTAFLVNTARGGIVDEADLYDCLKREVIAGAGIDPFVVEPPSPDHPLFALDDIIVSPHSAGNTEESMFRMGATAAQNVVDCFNGKLNPENVINKEVL